MTTPKTMHCDVCGEPSEELVSVELCAATRYDPAEWAALCPECLDQPRKGRRLSTYERHQMAADAGQDTWEDFRGER